MVDVDREGETMTETTPMIERQKRARLSQGYWQERE
jgi:hypothetical protein